MPLYENTLIVRQDMSTQEVDKLTESFSKIVNDNKGKIVKKEYWGLRNLAYKVNKNNGEMISCAVSVRCYPLQTWHPMP